MAIFSRKKKRQEPPSHSNGFPVASSATVSVFVSTDKIQDTVVARQNKWNNYLKDITYPYSQVILEGENGVVIAVPSNSAAMSIMDEINDFMRMRRAAKLVAAEDYSSTSD